MFLHFIGEKACWVLGVGVDDLMTCHSCFGRGGGNYSNPACVFVLLIYCQYMRAIPSGSNYLVIMYPSTVRFCTPVHALFRNSRRKITQICFTRRTWPRSGRTKKRRDERSLPCRDWSTLTIDRRMTWQIYDACPPPHSSYKQRTMVRTSFPFFSLRPHSVPFRRVPTSRDGFPRFCSRSARWKEDERDRGGSSLSHLYFCTIISRSRTIRQTSNQSHGQGRVRSW